jgi:uncharacterized protein (UPF0332 family)
MFILISSLLLLNRYNQSVHSFVAAMLPCCHGEEEDTCMSYEEEDTCMSYEEEDTCMSYEEEDTCMSYEEEDTCMSYTCASWLPCCHAAMVI